MKAFILAGGEGRRLRPYTNIFPKPLLPINGKPILEIILDKLKSYGIKEVILGTNYKSELLEMFFGDGSSRGLDIYYSKENKPLGTIGPIKLVENRLEDNFLVMNGDILTDLDITKFANFHRELDADISVVTKKIKIPLDYGLIKSIGNKIQNIEEKPSLESEISTGIYMMNSRVIKHIPSNDKYNMTDLMNSIIALGGNVSKYAYEGRWIDIGKIGDYEKAQSELLDQFKE